MKFDELCNELMVENMNQKGIEKEDVEYLVYFNKKRIDLIQTNEVGDPESGKWTQEQRDKWRKDAEYFAQEWNLKFEDRGGDEIPLEEVEDSELTFEIEKKLESREANFFWDVFEKIGLENPSVEFQQEICQAMGELAYDLENNPREFDNGLEELNNKILSLK